MSPISQNRIEQELHLTFRYAVHFTEGVFSSSNTILRDAIAAHADYKPARTVFIVDSGVAACHPGLSADIEAYCLNNRDTMTLAAPVCVIAGGEDAKNDEQYLAAILETINRAGICRHSWVVAIGGGAALDVVGYAAAIAHRGVRLIRIPTTVLAQDDSGLGVKNGINYFGKKNYLGTFATAVAVINDINFLTTLPDRDWLCGLTEAIKVGLIKDGRFFGRIESSAGALVNRDLAAMQPIIRRSAELHLDHIASSGDPFELGSSRPLDFGHWAAHKLEFLSDYRIRHGEAVGIGIALDSTYSWLSGLLAETDWRRIIDLLLALRLPVYAPELGAHILDVHHPDASHPRSVLRGLTEFREHLGGELTISLLRGIGDALDVHEIDTARMIKSITELKKRAEAQETSGAGNYLATAGGHHADERTVSR
jgi:3-dehydroquinate synthase